MPSLGFPGWLDMAGLLTEPAESGPLPMVFVALGRDQEPWVLDCALGAFVPSVGPHLAVLGLSFDTRLQTSLTLCLLCLGLFLL